VKFTYPYYGVRLLGGVVFFSGMLIMAYNVWMTVRQVKPRPIPLVQPA
jgi:cytochrome c oxidase cbb3-type subunit 1